MIGVILNRLLCLTLVVIVAAQNSSTNNGPTGGSNAIAGDYSGPLRPQVHYSPPRGFMNDPNGMFKDAKGVYHLYYQYNPTGLTAGNVHWGHATSKDLYSWQNQPIALWPGRQGEQIFSGSAVIDSNNTSGFFPNQTDGVVAIYTLLNPNNIQSQDIAYSRDGGYTFTKYQNNPVLDIGSEQFRDPKVIWHAPTRRWVMVISYASEYVIGVYTSSNLKQWTHASNFSHAGLLGIQYECPNLVEIPMEGMTTTMWLMYISINPGAPLGGSIGQYFPGTFNGTHFRAVDAAARISDFAKDNYAEQFFFGIPGSQRQVSIAWASNWQYTNVVPTASEGWRSAMSAPRINYLKNLTMLGYDLVSLPYNISAIYDSPLASNSSFSNGTVSISFNNTASRAVYFEIKATNLTMATLTGTLNFTISSPQSGEYIEGGTFISTATAWLSRKHIDGFENPYFTDKFSQTGIYGMNGNWSISGIFDRSIFELFVNGGEQSATSVFYPTAPLTHVSISSGGIPHGVNVEVKVWGLKSGWPASSEGGYGYARRDGNFVIETNS